MPETGPKTHGADTSVAAPDNSSLDVKYVGTTVCAECHKEEHASYLNTSHSATTRQTVVRAEPAPGEFDNPYSGFKYGAIHRGGDLVHRETRFNAAGKVVGNTEARIEYSIGSGKHGKSYVFRDQGYWFQSPISWFHETRQWGMSPGYDKPFHQSFMRKIDDRCFFCHVGSVDRKQGNPFDFDVIETTVGCERCHGPGQLHVQRHKSKRVHQGSDSTIVNPVNLSRKLSEAICHQCHLMGISSSIMSEKSEWDFRPGLPLTDYRIDYQHRLGDDTMKIVGHVEQLHMSPCYQKSETLTCITCHDPHHVIGPENSIDAYRSICLNCHEDQACPKPLTSRMTIANNDCTQCHMPAAATDVPHTAFRHHRIGLHAQEEIGTRLAIAGLTPIIPSSDGSASEQARSDALVKVQTLRDHPGNPDYAEFGEQAARALIQLKQAGTDDADLNAALAWLAKDQGQTAIAVRLAKEVRAKEPSPTMARIEATRLLAQTAFRSDDRDRAMELYRELTGYSRDSVDYYFLGLCEQNVGDSEKAIVALKKSLDIDPSQESAHQALHAIFQSTQNFEKAEYHLNAAGENRALQEKLGQHARQFYETGTPK